MNPARESIATEQFGAYEVYERLGMGGMASVHRAKKRGPAGFERTVALKRMLSHLTEDRGFVDSFVREAKVASLLAHPNIAQTYDFGRINGIFYIAMELVQGYDVRKILRHAHKVNEPIPLPVVMSIIGELCDALDYAHSFVDENGQPMHIVHRDISPSNMIVSGTGHLKVIDFGIAKANSRQLHTETGTVKGKLGYMAPETALGMPVGPVSDIFSMGVVAWELVTAMPLFSARTDFETMRKLREEQVTAPSQYNSACPPMLDQLIQAALHRDADRRLQSARAFRATIDSICQQYGISTSARAVADWMRHLMPEPEPRPSFVPSSQSRPLPLPAGPETRVSRPGGTGRPSTLRRSQEQIQLATEIWGEEGTQGPQDNSDFSMAMGGSQQGHAHAQHSGMHPEPLPYTPLGLSVPSLAPQPLRPSMGSVQLAPPIHTGNVPPIHTGNVPSVSKSKAPLFALAGLAIVAGILGGILYARRAPQHAAGGPKALLHFSITPEGSLIEVAGHPLETGVVDSDVSPGVYTVSVKHDGYKPWVSSIELSDGEKQTINVALEKADAVVAIEKPIEQHAGSGSAEVAVVPTPGEDTGSATPDDDPDAGKSTPTGNKHTTTHSSGGNKHTTTHSSGNTVAMVAGAGSQDTEVKTDPVKTDPVKTDPVKTDPVKTDPVKTDPVKTDPVKTLKTDPVKTDPVDTKPKTTPVVGPNVVQKLSGELPSLRSDTGGTVTAKMCIDEQGRVTSVKILKGPPDVAADLQRALMSWKFRPYTNRDSKLSPVCFPQSLRVLTK